MGFETHTERQRLYRLKMIAKFIVDVYIPTWFLIKVKHHWTEGPRHVLYQLMQLRKQFRIIDIVMPTVQRGAWYAFSENIFQTMLYVQIMK